MPISHRLIASLPRSHALPRSSRIPAILARSYHASPCLLRVGGGFRREPGTSITGDGKKDETPDRRPVEASPDTFSSLNVYEDIPPPGSAIETVFDDGFQFSNHVSFYDGAGALLVDNEVFKWRPAERGSEIEKKAMRTGILELGPEAWGMLDVVHPKPGRSPLFLRSSAVSRSDP
jgi:hypothetical protein